MIMFHGDLLMRRVTETIDRLVETGIYSQWNCKRFEYHKLHSKEIGVVQMLDEYYSFKLYHMQPPFYLLFMGWCLSAFCFIAEVLYNRVLRHRTRNLEWVDCYFNLNMAVFTQDYVNHNSPTSSLARFQRVKRLCLQSVCVRNLVEKISIFFDIS